MKVTSLRHCLLLLLVAATSACGIGAAPKNPPAETPPAVTPEEADDDGTVVTPDDGDESEDDADGIDDSERQRQIERNAKKRKQLLAKMDTFATWRGKFPVASQWTISFDYQTYKPRHSAREEIVEREDLFDLALREYLTTWETQSRDIAKSDRDKIDVFSRARGIQNMVAIALSMDQRNALQDKYARRYGMELFSVFGLVRDTLIEKRHLKPETSFEATIAGNETTAIEILEWRMNAHYVWAWEILFREELNPGPFENRTVLFEPLQANDMVQAVNFLNRANVAAQQIGQIKKDSEKVLNKFVNVNPVVRSAIGRMRLEKFQRALDKAPSGPKKAAGLRLIAEVRKAGAMLK